MKETLIKYSEKVTEISLDWNDTKWDWADAITLAEVRPESRGLLPVTSVKMIWGKEGINGIFKVEDHSLLAKYTKDQEPVWRESCVEFYVKPKDSTGYMNFEFNCLGTLLSSHVINHERTKDGFKDWRFISKEDCQDVLRKTSIKEPTAVEVKRETEWYLEFFIPIFLLEKYFGNVGIQNGDKWLCNFYKCGDDLSNPHWISWSGVRELNFHNPEDFGSLIFVK
ncbi:MAG: carbohydrate-binding family 9-like protein [Ignavibacteriaceae bacterium]